MGEPPQDADSEGKARRGWRLAIVYGTLVLLLAGFGAGRLWDGMAALTGQIGAVRHAVAVNLAARNAYAEALKADSPAPRTIAPLPHRISFYPPLARRRHEQGDVILKVLVLPSGQVGDVEVLQSSGSAQLDAAALVSVGSWVYLPAVKGHRPVAAWTRVRVRFQLSS